MKKTLAALAVLGAFAGTAAAADVTLYGVVDTGFGYTYNKTTDFDGTSEDSNSLTMESGINAGSRFGLKGVEDLGNGMKVGFKLENGFTSDDGKLGQGDRLFDREASLTVYSEHCGQLSFGRMGGLGSSLGTYDVVYGIGDAFDGGDWDVWGLASSFRYDNMLTYQSPKVYGLQATVQYSFKIDNKDTDTTKVEGESTADRYASVALTGEYGPAQAVVAYELTKYSTRDRINTPDMDDGNVIYVGGNYDFGVAKVFAMGQYFAGLRSFGNVFDDDEVGTVGNDFVLGKKGVEGYGLHLGTVVPVAAGELTVGAYYLDGTAKADTRRSNVSKAKDMDMSYYGIAARYTYPLSNRTTVYVGGGYGEATADSLEAKKSQTLSGTYKDDAKDKTGTAYVGLTHTF